MLSSNMAASIATEIHTYFMQASFYIILCNVLLLHELLHSSHNNDRCRACCLWLPWISRPVCTIRWPGWRTAWHRWKRSISGGGVNILSWSLPAHLYGSDSNTVEPRYNEVLGTIKITSLLYQVSHYIRVKKQRNIKSWDQQNYLVIRGFCYIRLLYDEVPLYCITDCLET